MSKRSLQPLLRPASVAVLGASERPGSVGNEVFVNLQKSQFKGSIYLVNPAYDSLHGAACFPALDALPEVPEHVIFAVSDNRIEDCFDQMLALGIRACTIFSALIVSDDKTPNLRQRLQDKINQNNVLVAGANCMGFYNIRDKFMAGGFDTRTHPHPGNVSLISQSGAGMSGIVDVERRIDFNFAASTGYELSVSLEDYLDYVLDMPETRVVGLFMETSRHPQQLIAAFKKAAEKQIPIVVLKVGSTALSAQMALSHTGALAGSDAAYGALFERYGVQRVADMDQLATALIMFSQTQPMGDGDLVCLHDSGGERQLLIDLADAQQVPLTKLSPQTEKRIAEHIDPGLPIVNPLDGWGAGGSDAHQRMANCFEALVADSHAAVGAVVHDRGPDSEVYPIYINYLKQALKANAKPVFLVANRQGSGSDTLAITSTQDGLPVIDGVSQFLVGVRCMLNYRDFLLQELSQNLSQELAQKAESLPKLDPTMVDSWRNKLQSRQVVSESLCAQCLADFGLPMVQGTEIKNKAELSAYAQSATFPLVLKTAEPQINHKSDVNAVALNIESKQQLLTVYADFKCRLGSRALIAPMITDPGVEMILGVVNDPQLGPLIVIGFGGVYAELLEDRVALLAPFSEAAAKRALQNLKMKALLNGYRGQSAVNIDALCRAASLLSVIADELKETVAEIDINPLLVTSDGCQGLDALMLLL